MAKKYKRQVSNRSAETSQETRSAQKTSRTSVTEFNPNYDYVIKDLKRIGILAGSFFVILIVLSFFLR